ncbi:type II secretion system protein [Halorhodospira halophila]|uniref:type II secretion system protein n=1 Tax=Halorhodospira halophila TaxID=1053 RepID=UPI0031F6DAFE
MQVTIDRVQRRDTCLRKATGPRGSGFVASAAQRGLTLIEMIVTIVVLGIAMAALASFYPLLAQLPDAEEAERAARNAESCAELIIAAFRDGKFDPDLLNDGYEISKEDKQTLDEGDIDVTRDLWGAFCGGGIVVFVYDDTDEAVRIVKIDYEESAVSGLSPLYIGF